MTAVRRWWLLSAVLLIGLAALDAAAADAVNFNVRIVKASRGGGGWQGPQDLKNELQRLGFSSAAEAGGAQFALNEGEAKKFDVAGNIWGQVLLRQIHGVGAAARIAFNFSIAGGGNINYTIPKGGRTIIIGPEQGNSRYVIVITGR